MLPDQPVPVVDPEIERLAHVMVDGLIERLAAEPAVPATSLLDNLADQLQQAASLRRLNVMRRMPGSASAGSASAAWSPATPRRAAPRTAAEDSPPDQAKHDRPRCGRPGRATGARSAICYPRPYLIERGRSVLAVVTSHVLRSYARRLPGAGRPRAVRPLRRPTTPNGVSSALACNPDHLIPCPHRA
jgi:hypothetical protein